MEKIDRIIEIIKYLKEDGMSLGAGQIAGTVEAGDDPPVRKRRKKYISGGRGSRKFWIDYLKNK